MSNESSSAPANAHGIVWFEIPADNPQRAQSFYGSLFGWKINPFPGGMEYWHIDTGGADASPDGGMLTRKYPNQPITNYINVPSVDEFGAKVVKLGGKICMGKTAVPQMGYFVICEDTEGNTFALWEMSPDAK
ncbi:MAG TPA: VOC family protein [Candidatus Limnocylindria bacterium]|jgi:predicted enzyme related to lactoylglutathione lyase|nr:VOC family protein [Candidatus Limnocylindria bacterium]